MFENKLNTTYRTLLKDKSFLVINIFGLAVAIASSIVILLFAKYELGFDSYHVNADRIHLVVKERNTAQGIRELNDTWVPLLATMRARYPEIKDGVRIFERSQWVEVNAKKFQELVTYADPSLFSVFSYRLALGDAGSALDGTTSIVLSHDTALKYFGDTNPIGQRLTLNFSDDYLVTGVLQDLPQNMSLLPDIIVPFESAIAPDDEVANANWGSSFLHTYLLLDDSASAGDLESRFPDLINTLFGQDGPNGVQNMRFRLFPLSSMRDREAHTNATSYVLLAIAFGIILISCVNFMNLTTARSMERAREVGVRKTLGALREQLLWQFLGESMLISVLALLAGIGIAELMLPIFNTLYALDLALNLPDDLGIFALLILVGLGAGLLSGSYPAFFMSAFKITDTLKGKVRSSKHGLLLRNTLSVVQFSMAIILIIGVVVIWQQIRHMKSYDLNFDPEQVLVIPASLHDFADPKMAVTRMNTFKNELLRVPGVESVSASMSVPGNYVNANTFVTPEGWQQDEPLRMLVAGVDDSYFKTYGIRFVEGRDFSRDFSTESDSIIINETAMRDMGWDTAIGKKVNNRWTVVGVVQDFNYASLQNKIAAIIHPYGAQDSQNHRFVSIKLNTNNLPRTLQAIESQWRVLDPTRPFTYYFVQDSFEEFYKDVDNINTIIGYFSLLSLFIANLSLFGLSSYSVVQRTKEIGVRRVLGATVPNILLLLSQQFTKPVLIANLLAWPLAYVGISQWLQGFAYRIQIDWLIFVLAGIFVLLLAIATVCIHAAKSVSTNPAQALRYE